MKRKNKYTPLPPLDEILKDIREYNEKHGTYITYGKYVALLRQGKIKK